MSDLPVADELRVIRVKSALLAKTLGYGAVAKAIRSGGPIEPNIRFIRNTISGRKATGANPLGRGKMLFQPLTDAEKRFNAKVDAMQNGLDALLDRLRELGGG